MLTQHRADAGVPPKARRDLCAVSAWRATWHESTCAEGEPRLRLHHHRLGFSFCPAQAVRHAEHGVLTISEDEPVHGCAAHGLSPSTTLRWVALLRYPARRLVRNGSVGFESADRQIGDSASDRFEPPRRPCSVIHAVAANLLHRECTRGTRRVLRAAVKHAEERTTLPRTPPSLTSSSASENSLLRACATFSFGRSFGATVCLYSAGHQSHAASIAKMIASSSVAVVSAPASSSARRALLMPVVEQRTGSVRPHCSRKARNVCCG